MKGVPSDSFSSWCLSIHSRVTFFILFMMYPNVLFSVLSFSGFVVCCIPFAGQVKAGNVGTCLYAVWTGLACLNLFINSIIWDNSVTDKTPIWCEISSRFIVGTAVAIPACSLCINRRLYQIVSSSEPLVTARILPVIADFGIGVGLPVVVVIFQHFLQSRPYNIYQEIGCYPVTKDSPTGIALIWVPPVVIGCISSIYSVLNLRKIFVYKLRLPLSNCIQLGSPILCIRLTCIICLYGFGIVPLTALSLYFHHVFDNVAPQLLGNQMMAHAGILLIDQQEWRGHRGWEVSLEFNRWLVVGLAFTFFALFWLAEEVQEGYRYYFSFLARLRWDSILFWRGLGHSTNDSTLASHV